MLSRRLLLKNQPVRDLTNRQHKRSGRVIPIFGPYSVVVKGWGSQDIISLKQATCARSSDKIECKGATLLPDHSPIRPVSNASINFWCLAALPKVSNAPVISWVSFNVKCDITLPCGGGLVLRGLSVCVCVHYLARSGRWSFAVR